MHIVCSQIHHFSEIINLLAFIRFDQAHVLRLLKKGLENIVGPVHATSEVWIIDGEFFFHAETPQNTIWLESARLKRQK